MKLMPDTDRYLTLSGASVDLQYSFRDLYSSISFHDFYRFLTFPIDSVILLAPKGKKTSRLYCWIKTWSPMEATREVEVQAFC